MDKTRPGKNSITSWGFEDVLHVDFFFDFNNLSKYKRIPIPIIGIWNVYVSNYQCTLEYAKDYEVEWILPNEPEISYIKWIDINIKISNNNISDIFLYDNNQCSYLNGFISSKDNYNYKVRLYTNKKKMCSISILENKKRLNEIPIYIVRYKGFIVESDQILLIQCDSENQNKLSITTSVSVYNKIKNSLKLKLPEKPLINLDIINTNGHKNTAHFDLKTSIKLVVSVVDPGNVIFSLHVRKCSLNSVDDSDVFVDLINKNGCSLKENAIGDFHISKDGLSAYTKLFPAYRIFGTNEYELKCKIDLCHYINMDNCPKPGESNCLMNSNIFKKKLNSRENSLRRFIKNSSFFRNSTPHLRREDVMYSKKPNSVQVISTSTKIRFCRDNDCFLTILDKKRNYNNTRTFIASFYKRFQILLIIILIFVLITSFFMVIVPLVVSYTW
ncbi:hypothetical protein A3Q56_05566, partial [Intoshia linei]